jgi:hypothetical protein
MSDESMTPSQRIVAEGNQSYEIKDARGRTLTLQALTILEQIKLMRAMGPDQSRNIPYSEWVQAAATVRKIDGVPRRLPQNEAQIDASIAAVDDVGFAGIQAFMRQKIDEMKEAADAALAAINAVEGTEGVAEPDPFPKSTASSTTRRSRKRSGS